MAETLDICVFNAVGVETGEKNGERVMQQAARFGQVLLGCEADNIDTRDRTNPVPGYRVFHKAQDLSKDGAIVAYDGSCGIKQSGGAQWDMMSKGQPGKMNSRYLLSVPIILPNGAHVQWGAFHAAPSRYPLIRAEGMRAVKHAHVDLFGGDLNLVGHSVRGRFQGRAVRSAELLHVVAKKDKDQGYRLKASPRTVVLRGSDHPGLVVTVILD